jgi:DNA-binding CsgD family transcriptional regulator
MRADGRAALLERETELAAIGSMLDAASSGRGSMLVVEGAPGVGKTSLLRAGRGAATERGIDVRATRAAEGEQDFAWGAVRALLGGDAEDALQPAGTENPGQFAVLHALYWVLVAQAAERPTLLVVDDAQWADAGSLRWLSFLRTRLEELPVAVLVATRPVGEAAESALIELAADPEVGLVTPVPLSRAAVDVVVAGGLGATPHPEFGRACLEATGGNPFLLTELIRGLATDGCTGTDGEVEAVEGLRPQAVSRAVLLRLARLPPDARDLARAAAVLGDGAELRHAASLAGLAPHEAEEAFTALAEAYVVDPEPPLVFVHPIVRTTIVDDQPALERQRRHRAAAALLNEARAGGRLVAHHVLAGGPAGEQWARDVLAAEGRRAAAEGAVDEAAALLRAAIDEMDEPDVSLLRELGAVEHARRGVAGAPALREALALARDPRERIDIALQLAHGLNTANSAAEAVSVLGDALEGVDVEADETTRAAEAYFVHFALQETATEPLAEARFVSALTRLGSGEPADSAIRATLALGATRAGDLQTGREQARLALSGAPDARSTTQAFACLALMWCDELEEAARVWDASLASARAVGERTWLSLGSCMRAQVALRAGDLAEAEGLAIESRTFAEVWETHVPPQPAAFHAEALLGRGRLDEAVAALRPWSMDGELPENHGFRAFLLARGRVRAAIGDVAGGVADLLECGRRVMAQSITHPGMFAWRSEAALALLATDPERARALADEELELARATGGPRTLGMALNVAGLARGGDEGLALLREAVDTLRGGPARLASARALVDLGAALRRAGSRTEARPLLSEGLDLASSCGAIPVADRAREELVAAGARPRRERLHGVEALTSSETRVARLAAQGQSNREIAQALFVTLRTVETHLTHVYRKLDIESRDALPGALAGPATHAARV